jgi:hypothetical protein
MEKDRSLPSDAVTGRIVMSCVTPVTSFAEFVQICREEKEDQSERDYGGYLITEWDVKYLYDRLICDQLETREPLTYDDTRWWLDYAFIPPKKKKDQDIVEYSRPQTLGEAMAEAREAIIELIEAFPPMNWWVRVLLWICSRKVVRDIMRRCPKS